MNPAMRNGQKNYKILQHSIVVLLRSPKRALQEAKALLERDSSEISPAEIHRLKSVLYAAIEETGTKAERLAGLQRMLRELFSLVFTIADIHDHERQVGLQIISELAERFGIKI